MADDWLSIAGILATVLVSGLVGAVLGALLSPWLTQRLQDKRELRKDVLDPIYDYAARLDSHEPEQVLPDSPWISVPLSTRQRLKEEQRSSIEQLSEAGREFTAENSKLNQHLTTVMATGVLRRFLDQIKPAYVDVNDSIPGDLVGLPANWTIAGQTLSTIPIRT